MIIERINDECPDFSEIIWIVIQGINTHLTLMKQIVNELTVKVRHHSNFYGAVQKQNVSRSAFLVSVIFNNFWTAHYFNIV
ncbi:hypothetical protein ACIQZG_00210 [Lysinibacillus sp. NPDC096418]|uniref:hypothetical protein n=1 Tax=Lysinibacillus sp. NPDC096418 TaxID=3364138 RepID=UPI00380E2197